MDLSGKKMVVTGAGSGLGKAAALLLAERGAAVALISRHRHELDETAAAIREAGGTAHIIVADISDEEDVRAAFAAAAAEFGTLDGVFANAGINGTWAPIDDLTYAEWNQTMAVNLGGTFLTLKYGVPLMKERGGAIVITSSINGTRSFSLPGASAYSTSKAGLLALGQMAALELARHRIRVNIVCPGAITTQIGDSTIRRNTEEARYPADYPEGRVPLTGGKFGAPSDVAKLVCFLLSDESSHITGTPVWIDGAQSLLI